MIERGIVWGGGNRCNHNKTSKERKVDKSWFNDFQKKSENIDKKTLKFAMQGWSVLENINLTFDKIYCAFMGAFGQKYIHFLNKDYYARYMLIKLQVSGM